MKMYYSYTVGKLSMKSKNTNSLKYLMNEVMSQRQTIQRMNTVKNSAITLDERAINALIRSRVFTLNEQKAMRILFSKTKTTSLTENTVKTLDENVRVISKSNENTKFYTYYGDSKITLLDYVISKPLYTFDFCHIDGGHDMREVCNDFTYVRYLMKPGSPVMFDDYNLGWIRDFIQKRVEHNEIKLLPIQATELHTVYHYLSIC
jgi:hypothetical protein